MKLYNIQGQLVSTLVEDEMQAGNYTVPFDGRDLAPGVYFYQIKMGSYQAMKKMVLVQ